MKYGFIIDNRKCIGCHACTTACKSEHDVPVGVNRTYVKQVEKGQFPDTRRIFSVMRCNHCTHAPCVEICPVEALYTRDDGIVDFDNNRCIGCKSCMQACPYDALYIDPENQTAAKCNYCAHRIEVGRAPACVDVCPEHAIIAGDIHNPDTEIATLLSREQVMVRKPEKGTQPNLFYIDGDHQSLDPEATDRSGPGLWNSQARGVGHYARAAEKMSHSSTDLDLLKMTIDNEMQAAYQKNESENPNYIDVLNGKARRVYDTPDKGILWGWEVTSYVLTKGVAAGLVMIAFLSWLLGVDLPDTSVYLIGGAAMLFLALTGLFLVLDLDRPDRFLNVLLRPQWNSWLVKGGYTLTAFGLFLSLWMIATLFELEVLSTASLWLLAPAAVLLAVYTAFLFAQAKGRDFWQSPTLPFHMLIHSLMAGAAAIGLMNSFNLLPSLVDQSTTMLKIGLVVNLLLLVVELSISHPTKDAKKVVNMILKGRYSKVFWIYSIIIGNIVPLLLMIFFESTVITAVASLFLMIGIYFTEKIWVEAPQRIALA